MTFSDQPLVEGLSDDPSLLGAVRTRPVYVSPVPSNTSPADHSRTVEFDPGCEAMIFTTQGVPLQGITGGYNGDRRVEFIIPHEARKQGKLDFVIESSCNGMFGVGNGGDIEPPDVWSQSP